MKTFLKFATIVTICFASWWCTSALMAQQRKKPARTGQAGTVTTSKGTTVTTPKGTTVTTPTEAFLSQPGTIAIDSDVLIATASIKSCKVEVADGMVTVNAQVSLSNRLRKDVYIWRLSLLDARGKVLDQIVYDNQIFGMEADGAMEPTFSEAAPLVPGTSLVQLSLFAFRPGTDLTIFKDQQASEGYTILRRVTKL